MTDSEIARLRLRQQQLSQASLRTPGEVVAWFGAVQAQEYLASLWAIGLRLRGATERDIEQAIEERSIVRTWFMRGTIHFVPALDLGWMMALMAPRMRALIENVNRYNKLGLDEATFTRSHGALERALQGGKQSIRAELTTVLEQAGIPASGVRLSLLLQRAQTDGLLCYGARRGKQATFTLREEWVPASKTLAREEALAELARRYITSHGPATLQDFVWWSGLTTAEAGEGLALARPAIVEEEIRGQRYWLPASLAAPADSPEPGHLLPNYDEYLVGYKERRAALDPRHTGLVAEWSSVVLGPTMAVEGRVLGTWQRSLKAKKAVVALNPFTPLTDDEARVVDAAAARYGAFLGLPVELIMEKTEGDPP